MSKYLILGDPHLGKGINIGKTVNGSNSRIQDQINLLQWVLDTAIEKDVKSIIVTGDVYQEPRPHPAIIKIFMTWVVSVINKGIDLHIIAGNHDIIRTGAYTVSALDIIPVLNLPNVKVYKNVQTIEYDDVSITIVPFRDRVMYDSNSLSEAYEMLKGEIDLETPKSDFKICIGHVAIEGSLYVGDEVDNISNEIFCKVEDFSKFDYTWMGHIHHPQVLSKNPYVAHVGSMDRSDFGVTETKYDKIIVVVDGETRSFENIVMPNRPLRHCKIEVPADKNSTEFVMNSLFIFDKKNNLTDSILKLEVTLDGAADNIDRKKIENYAYNALKAFHIPYLTESRNINVVSAEKQSMLKIDMGEEKTIQTYADMLEFESESDKQKYIEITMSLLDELRSK